MGSTRLPGKVLEDVGGRPVLLRIVERVRAATAIDEVVVVTSSKPSDDALYELCTETDVEVFRGSEHDVLDRFIVAARTYRPDVVVRVTGDCPLIDPHVVDDVVSLLTQTPSLVFASVATGALKADSGRRRYPDGLDVEAMTETALAIAAEEARDPFDREHVTPFIWKHPGRFPAALLEADHDMGNERWTLDYPSDLEFIRAIYERLEGLGSPFGCQEILAVLEREPELRELNAAHRS